MSRRIATLFVGAVAALAAPFSSHAAQEEGLSRTYLMQGLGFGSGDAGYEGTCTFTGDGPAYQVACFNKDTRHTYVGRGLVMGDTLALTIGDELRGDHGALFAGEYLVVYARKADGSFEGSWIDVGGRQGRESLKPLD